MKNRIKTIFMVMVLGLSSSSVYSQISLGEASGRWEVGPNPRANYIAKIYLKSKNGKISSMRLITANSLYTCQVAFYSKMSDLSSSDVWNIVNTSICHRN